MICNSKSCVYFVSWFSLHKRSCQLVGGKTKSSLDKVQLPTTVNCNLLGSNRNSLLQTLHPREALTSNLRYLVSIQDEKSMSACCLVSLGWEENIKVCLTNTSVPAWSSGSDTTHNLFLCFSAKSEVMCVMSLTPNVSERETWYC